MTIQLRLGTRGSLLAKTQTEWVATQLRKAHPDLEIITQIIQTTGDLKSGVPFAEVGTKGMFVKELETALLQNEIDVAVHSLKDMPAELPQGLELACIPVREDPRDALISRKGETIDALPHGTKVGTSSARRTAILRDYRSDFDVEELRGNLDTRLRKLDEGQYDAILLACAGLNRLGLGERISQALPVESFVPAVAQGALALETRVGDKDILALLLPIHHEETALQIRAERAFLGAVEGGCSVPVGAFASLLSNNKIQLRSLIADESGNLYRDTLSGERENAEEIGRELAFRSLAARK
ncbi:MAG: hydroxymethylbilane synthase [Chthonomonadaceae bacterium]|nr:hydroxymethylbilane synthase [Chthonomonadaceae bacterium]